MNECFIKVASFLNAGKNETSAVALTGPETPVDVPVAVFSRTLLRFYFHHTNCGFRIKPRITAAVLAISQELENAVEPFSFVQE